MKLEPAVISTAITVKEFKKGKLPSGNPVYVKLAYSMTSKENVTLSAGSLKEMIEVVNRFGTYYDECFINVRQYDFYLNNNTKVSDSKMEMVL